MDTEFIVIERVITLKRGAKLKNGFGIPKNVLMCKCDNVIMR